LLARIAKHDSPSSTTTKAGNPKDLFVMEYILGIMAHFTDIVDNYKQMKSSSEKRRALKAIKHLVCVAKSGTIMALPQVS